uniref:Small ribosomal subunit protein uS3m n=1 Tax=Roya anglica TaxID=43943 RepID=A0A6G9IET3_9VIRI|nr:ribosomal protein S3 [Roya anglica]QIQ22972.1 ribosomal protein S3 [Roya anglica]
MSQKINPIAVRLKFNRTSDSSWFSDYYYSSLLFLDFNFQNYLKSITDKVGSKNGFQMQKCIIYHLPKKSTAHIKNTLSFQTNNLVKINPINISNLFQSASLVAQEIAWKLEQKKSFRTICRTLFLNLRPLLADGPVMDIKKIYKKNRYIKGIRISCSGRLNGAEIAKTECKKYSETSLHVFSDKIDYAFVKALTPYGILGIKVWISYVK